MRMSNPHFPDFPSPIKKKPQATATKRPNCEGEANPASLSMPTERKTPVSKSAKGSI